MRRAHVPSLVAALVLCAGIGPPAAAGVTSQLDGPRVLLLHDSAGPYGFLGSEYAIALQNLLGHFRARVTVEPASSYTAGQIQEHDATFYLGTTYEELAYYFPGSTQRASYEAFLADAAKNAKPVIWLGFNLWRLAWFWDPSWGAEGFGGRFGFEFWGYVDDGYNRVNYKGVDLFKGAVLHVNPGAVLEGCVLDSVEPGVMDCDTSVGVAGVVDAAKATVFAQARSTSTGAQWPYVTRGGRLWFVGDIPFSFISEEDRYLAFADMLHDMLGIDHAENHRALVRLEDVSPATSEEELRRVEAVLDRHHAPYGVGVIPFYEDPLRVGGGGSSRNELSRSGVARVLRDMKAKGAAIVQHGTTHQLDRLLNPFNGLTGDDFEFYRVTRNDDWSLNFIGPVPGDSEKWATDRVAKGRRELERAKLGPALGFEAPHYTASATDYRAIAKLYPVTWARVVYFASGAPGGRFIGQFFPYETVDVYGHHVIPENLGNIEPEIWNGYPQILPEEIVRRARKALVVRDGFASFFFHPDYPPELLDRTLAGIESIGKYEFVRACTVVARC